MPRELLKQLVIIFALVILCALIARTLSGGETLSEYASKHPDIAYGTSETVSDDNPEAVSNGNSETVSDGNSTNK